jgi:hypothetical protein
MLMRNKVMASRQHILQSVRAAELLVAAVIDQPLVQAGHLGDMLVDNADIVGDLDNRDALVFI